MTDLRTAAQQALEAMESAEVDPHSSDAVYKAITALKAALVEDAMQKFTDVNQELMAALGCDHCNHPLYAAIKCRVCGREAASRTILDAAVLKEREACAQIADAHASIEGIAQRIAAEIRGQQ